MICRKQAQGPHTLILMMPEIPQSTDAVGLCCWILSDEPFMPRTSVPVNLPSCAPWAACLAHHLAFIPCIFISCLSLSQLCLEFCLCLCLFGDDDYLSSDIYLVTWEMYLPREFTGKMIMDDASSARQN